MQDTSQENSSLAPDNPVPHQSSFDDERTRKGPGNPLWKPGVSGNPLGRPKGSKNQTTIFREAIEQELTEMLARDAGNLLKVAIEKAREGDPAMLKLLIDKMLPMRKAEDASTKKSTPQITINVGKTGDGGIVIEGHADPVNEENEDEGQ